MRANVMQFTATQSRTNEALYAHNFTRIRCHHVYTRMVGANCASLYIPGAVVPRGRLGPERLLLLLDPNSILVEPEQVQSCRGGRN